ncbi:uncharacterized protein LOC108092156 isoform X2 [Drosophila ficusphila]|uniref:uncharacterized protein LOC108092156 isoform X2 n=1 Tax=Drosophila ficusphila TaxID=30025 RepID=UPI0007E7DD5F|nr:uncharacterized protein LOC108092156 isoform X2 [Drosophila ficusphila]
MRYICRTCSRMADPSAAKNLFEPSNSSVLRQIETLTNLKLKEDDKWPRFMCQDCQHDLQIAIEFRTACIEAQELLELQLKQVKQEEEAFESLAEQWLDDCPQEFANPSAVPEVDEDKDSIIVKELNDYVETVSATTSHKNQLLSVDTDSVVPDLLTDSQMSDENFELMFSPKTNPQSRKESEVVDNPDTSSHTCSKCGLEFDNLDELSTHKYHLHDVPLNTKTILYMI